jgi:hypothetical protein
MAPAPGGDGRLRFEATGFSSLRATVRSADGASTPFDAGTFTPDADGTVRGVIVLPAGFTPGAHALVVAGTLIDGTSATSTSPFVLSRTIAGAANLAFTGAPGEPIRLAGVAFLLLGIGLLALSRPVRR